MWTELAVWNGWNCIIPMADKYTSFQGFRESANPNLGFFSKVLVSKAPEIVRKDLGISSCCKRAPRCPWLLSFAFTTVWGSTTYEHPTVKVFSFGENLLLTSPTTAPPFSWLNWCKYDTLRESPLSALQKDVRAISYKTIKPDLFKLCPNIIYIWYTSVSEHCLLSLYQNTIPSFLPGIFSTSEND